MGCLCKSGDICKSECANAGQTEPFPPSVAGTVNVRSVAVFPLARRGPGGQTPDYRKPRPWHRKIQGCKRLRSSWAGSNPTHIHDSPSSVVAGGPVNSLRYRDGLFNPHVGGRRAQHDADAAGLHHEALLARVPESQIGSFQRQPDGSRLVRLERDALKSAQFLYGPLHRGIEALDVHLHHLIASAGPRVLDVHADGRLARGVHRIGRSAQVGILEGGVTQAESKRIQRLPLEVHIRAALADVVIHHVGQIAQRLDPSGDQPAGRIVVAKQHVGDSAALFLAGMRHVEDRRNIVLDPIDGIWEARNQNDDGFRIRRFDALDQAELGLVEVNRLPVYRFLAFIRQRAPAEWAVACGMIAHEHDLDVGLGRQVGGVAVVIVRHITHTDVRPHLVPDASSGVTVYGGIPAYQSTSTLSPYGPITAMERSLLLSRGRRLSLFLSRTMDS